MHKRTEKFALVLGGGGAKGIYQMGAWKALRELGIEIEAVFGTSIGALNAGLIAQDDFNIAMNLWNTASLRSIIALPENYQESTASELFYSSIETIRSLMTNKGLDTSPMEKMIKDNFDIEKIRKRGIDIGIVTFELNTLKPHEIFLNQMEDDSITPYIMASARFPGFRGVYIKGQRFLDGGIYNNLPISMAVERGYRNVIAINVSNLGTSKSFDDTCLSLTRITNKNIKGNTFNFAPEVLNFNFELGYLDTLRTFGNLQGSIFYVKNGELNIDEKFSQIKDFEIQARAIMPVQLNSRKDYQLAFLEFLAENLSVEKFKLYSPKEFINAILNKYKIISNTTNKISASVFQKIVQDPSAIMEITQIRKFISDTSRFELAVIIEQRLGEKIANMIFPELEFCKRFLENLS